MNFNSNKCKVVRLGRDKNKQDFKYILVGNQATTISWHKRPMNGHCTEHNPRQSYNEGHEESKPRSVQRKYFFHAHRQRNTQEVFTTYVRTEVEYTSPAWSLLLSKHKPIQKSLMMYDKDCARNMWDEMQGKERNPRTCYTRGRRSRRDRPRLCSSGLMNIL